MPIKPCTKDGKSGFKYGDGGHCYTGPGAREKAAKQGRAIEISRHTHTKSRMQTLLEEIDTILNSAETTTK